MGRIYAVVGAGRQGLAAAYDLALFGEADEVRLFDQAAEIANQGKELLIGLFALAGHEGTQVTAAALDASDPDAAQVALVGADAVLSAVPYFLNPGLAKAAVLARASFCDLGGNTEIVKQELALDALAKEHRVTVTPDCGLAPGMANTLAAYLISEVAHPRAVHMRCGGLPQRPQPPLDYMLVFSIEGLTNEYMGDAVVIRDGEIERVPTLTELESLDIAGLGTLEAFATSGGTSTLPETYHGVLDTFDYKTVRYPGHLAKIRVLKELGLLDQTPVVVRTAKGELAEISLRAATMVALTEKLTFDDEPDLVFLRVTCHGEDEGDRPITRSLEILDYHNESTGFTAMERTTGFAAAIVCAHLASGRAPKGAVSLEHAMPGALFLEELKRRSIPVTETTTRSFT